MKINQKRESELGSSTVYSQPSESVSKRASNDVIKVGGEQPQPQYSTHYLLFSSAGLH